MKFKYAKRVVALGMAAMLSAGMLAGCGKKRKPMKKEKKLLS